MRGALVHLHPSRPDDSPPSVVQRHHKHENADKHSASSMSPHILPALCLTNMFRNTRTCRVRHSDIDMFLNTRRCCSEGGMRGVLVHLQPTRPRVLNRDRGHPRGALQESDRSLHERVISDFYILTRKSPSRLVSDSTRVRCKQARTRMISWSSTSNREDSWCGVGRSFYFESQGLILHIWGCTLDLMSEERIRRDSEASSFLRGRPRERTT